MAETQKQVEARNEASAYVARVLRDCLTADPGFTGKIVFNVNCRAGGIGGTEAFVQKKI